MRLIAAILESIDSPRRSGVARSGLPRRRLRGRDDVARGCGHRYREAALHREVRLLPHPEGRGHAGRGRAQPRQRLRLRAQPGVRLEHVLRGDAAPDEDSGAADAGLRRAGTKDYLSDEELVAIANYVAGCAGEGVAKGQVGQGCRGRRRSQGTDGKSLFAANGCGSCHTLEGRRIDRHNRPEPRRVEAGP